MFVGMCTHRGMTCITSAKAGRSFSDVFSILFKMSSALSLARTGLIFTRSLEGTQPDQLTQTSQTDGVFNTMCCQTC